MKETLFWVVCDIIALSMGIVVLSIFLIMFIVGIIAEIL